MNMMIPFLMAMDPNTVVMLKRNLILQNLMMKNIGVVLKDCVPVVKLLSDVLEAGTMSMPCPHITMRLQLKLLIVS